MHRLSTIPLLLAFHLSAIFLMLSCGSGNAPAQLTLRAPSGYSGTVHVETCMTGSAAAEVALDARGHGTTSLCPSPDQGVTLVVLRGSETVTMPPSEVFISRTGDKIATSVEARLQP